MLRSASSRRLEPLARSLLVSLISLFGNEHSNQRIRLAPFVPDLCDGYWPSRVRASLNSISLYLLFLLSFMNPLCHGKYLLVIEACVIPEVVLVREEISGGRPAIDAAGRPVC